MKLSDSFLSIKDVKIINLDSVPVIPDITGWKLIFFRNGKGRIFDGTEWKKYSENDIFLWNTNLKIKTEMSAQVYLFEFDFIPKGNIAEVDVMFEDYSELNSSVSFIDYEILSTEILEIYNEFRYKKIFYRERSSAILQKAIFLLFRSVGTKDDLVANKIDVVVDYIHKHYGENITNEDIGRQVNYHPHYLSKLMYEYKGMTLHKYLMEFRINNAKFFLRTSDNDIRTIAEECGFINFSHFTKIFKKSTGMTPTEFRKQYRK